MSDPPDVPAALGVDKITMVFGDLPAVADVSVDFGEGQVHAVVGENGAGKSTLMNLCFGILQPTSGDVRVHGQTVKMESPAVARRLGIAMVHQHFKLVPSLTVAENVFLGEELLTRRRTLDRRRMASKLADVSRRYGLVIDPTSRVCELSAGVRQRVEILKALYFNARVLILDEPSAILTPQETDALLDVIRGLADSGRAVVLITHKLREVRAVADRVTIMRGGRAIVTDDASRYSEREIATLMLGKERVPEREVVALLDVEETAAPDGSAAAAPRNGSGPDGRGRGGDEVAISCEDLVVADGHGQPRLAGVSLAVHAGEIVGIAGVEGNGQTELIEALAGLRPVTAGAVRMAGRDVTAQAPGERRAGGMAHIPEDRLESGIAGPSSVTENLIGGFWQSELFSSGVMRRPLAERWAGAIIRRYDIRGARPSTAVERLSGGNVQKVVLAREIESVPDVLLAAQPTRGVDLGATAFIHSRLRAERARGAAILLVSADLGELMALADRLLVMHSGRIVAEFGAVGQNVTRIGLAMTGCADAADAYKPPNPTDLRSTSSRGRPTWNPRGLTADLPDVAGQPALRTVIGPARRAAAALVQPATAVALALLIGLATIVALGDSPGAAYSSLLFGSFQGSFNFGGMVAQTTPLVLIGTSVYLSFRAGIFNIGGEGQMYVGAFLGAFIALKLSSVPGPLLIALAFIGGALGGAAWGFVPGLLNTYLDVDVLVSTLMFNYIAIAITSYLVDGPLRDPTGSTPETRQIPGKADLPTILGFSGANVGIFVGLIVLVVVGLVMWRTRWGLRTRFVGENRRFARYLGVDVRRQILQIMALSGAIAGVAGVVESLGTQLRFNQSFSPGYGFLGLTVALLGRLNPVGVALAAALYGALEEGASLMQLNTNVPLSLVNMLEGIIIILVTASALRIRGIPRRAVTTGALTPEPAAALGSQVPSEGVP